MIPSSAGLHVSGLLRRDVALPDDVVAHPLAPFYVRRARPGLALGFARIATKDIAEGVKRLAARVLAQR